MMDAPRVFTVTDGPQAVDLLFTGAASVFMSGGGLLKEGDGTMRIAPFGPSSVVITGPTVVNAGVLEVACPPNGLPVISGPLVVGDGLGTSGSAVVRLLDSNQIKTGVAVTVYEDGLFDLNVATGMT